jgi:Lon protease-like protein
MFELPLFPLNTVLFPGMPLHLHIFEERYKKMIKLCLERSFPFGVVLIERGSEALGPLAEPHVIGCTARIIEMQPLAEDRMNIIALGQERFRTILLDRQKAPYLNGIIEPFPLQDADQDAVRKASDRLKPWLQKYLQVLATVGGVELETLQIPDDPQTLAYLAAIALQVPNHEKQEFLATETTTQLLSCLLDVYQREVAILRAIKENPEPKEIGGFSIN